MLRTAYYNLSLALLSTPFFLAAAPLQAACQSHHAVAEAITVPARAQHLLRLSCDPRFYRDLRKVDINKNVLQSGLSCSLVHKRGPLNEFYSCVNSSNRDRLIVSVEVLCCE